MGYCITFMQIMKIPFLSRKFNAKPPGAGIVVVIGNEGVHFAQAKFIAGRPHVTAYGYFQIAGGRASAVTSAALDKFRKSLKISDTHFSTLLAPGEYQLLQVDAPNVPDEELKAAVRWSIKDLLNFHIDDAVLDVLRIPAAAGVVERKKTVYVVVTSRNLVNKRKELLQHAHFNLRVIDIPEMAQRNIAALYEEPGRSLALLAFDESGALLTFTCDGELYMARRMEISAGQLLDANESLRQQAVDRLELEVQRSIDNFDRQFSHIPLRRLLVSAPAQTGVVAVLAGSLDLPVELLDLGEVMHLDEVPGLANEEMRVYALHALGAALRREEA